eukprot:scaffold431_cov334-Pavlova_lutheri.AAC.13
MLGWHGLRIFLDQPRFEEEGGGVRGHHEDSQKGARGGQEEVDGESSDDAQLHRGAVHGLLVSRGEQIGQSNGGDRHPSDRHEVFFHWIQGWKDPSIQVVWFIVPAHHVGQEQCTCGVHHTLCEMEGLQHTERRSHALFPPLHARLSGHGEPRRTRTSVVSGACAVEESGRSIPSPSRLRFRSHSEPGARVG